MPTLREIKQERKQARKARPDPLADSKVNILVYDRTEPETDSYIPKEIRGHAVELEKKGAWPDHTCNLHVIVARERPQEAYQDPHDVGWEEVTLPMKASSRTLRKLALHRAVETARDFGWSDTHVWVRVKRSHPPHVFVACDKRPTAYSTYLLPYHLQEE